MSEIQNSILTLRIFVLVSLKWIESTAMEKKLTVPSDQTVQTRLFNVSSCSCNLRYVVTSLGLYHIKMGSDENRFKVSLIVRDQQSHKDNVPRPQLLKREESQSGIELRLVCLPA